MDLKQMGVETHVIDSIEYEFYCLKTSEALKTLTYILKVASESLGKVIAGARSVDNIKSILDNDDIDIEGIISSIVNRLDDPRTLEVAQTLVSSVYRNGKKLDFDTYFKGKILHLSKVLMQAGRVNFSDFLEELSGKLDTSQIKTPTTQVNRRSTGEFGESSTQDMAN